MTRDSLAFVRGVVMLAAGLLVIVAVALAVDVVTWRTSMARLTVMDYTEARFLADATNRGLNQLLAVTFTVVAIAVPLTANLYSLKFLEFFIKDQVNAAVLTLVVFADLVSFWVIFSLKQDFIPYFQLYAAFGLLVVCLGLLFPYLAYVFRFLHPSTLLQRLEAEIAAAVNAAARRSGEARKQRELAAEGLEHIANIAIRSIERTDRATAIESVLALERVARGYWRLKASLPAQWFPVDAELFQGFSSMDVLEISASRTWVEMKLFWQLRCILSAAIPRTHDVADTVARTLRHLGLEEPAREDAAVRDLVVDYFNTFLRLAISRRDAHSAFSLFDHYQLYAESLNAEQPALALKIAYFSEYYGQLARDNQLPFIVEAAAHDLGRLAWHAWQTGAPNREKLLERFLHFDVKTMPPLAGVKKAQAILASQLLQGGQSEAAEQIQRHFIGLDPGLVAELEDDLRHVKNEKYWEISERRVNLDYVPDAQREKLREFFEKLLTMRGG